MVNPWRIQWTPDEEAALDALWAEQTEVQSGATLPEPPADAAAAQPAQTLSELAPDDDATADEHEATPEQE